MSNFKKKSNSGNSMSNATASSYIENKTNAIVGKFLEDMSEGKSIYDVLITRKPLMNLVTGTIYGPNNTIFLENQMINLERNELVRVMRQYPVLNEAIEKVIAEGDLGKTLNIQNEIVKRAQKNKKIKQAFDECMEEYSKKSNLTSFFTTFVGGKNVYDFKGSNRMNIIQNFYLEINKPKLEKDETEEDKQEVVQKEEKEKEVENENEKDDKVIKNTFLKKSQKITGVFNTGQLKVLPGIEIPKSHARRIDAYEKKVEMAEVTTLVKAIEKASLYPIVRMPEGGAYFNRGTSLIVVPNTDSFKSPVEELHVIAHEMAHSYAFAAESGIKEYNRFKRDCYRDYHKDIKCRAKEELIANIAAGAVVASFNIETSSEDRERAFKIGNDSYDHGWSKTLGENIPKEDIMEIADMADKISGQIIFLIKKELTLMYENDKTVKMPSLIKEEIVSNYKKLNLDPEAFEDQVPTFKNEKNLNAGWKKPENLRRKRI